SAFLAAGCQTYAPAPVDLQAHSRLFADRIPDAELVRAFAQSLRRDPTTKAFDVSDGLSREEAGYVALLFNPSLRAVRAQAAVASATAELAGLWEDPQLSGSFFYVLENVWQHNWFAGAYVGQTLPITGLPGLEKALAESQHVQALIEARQSEADVLNRLDATWARLSAARLRVDLLEELVRRLADLEQVASSLAASQALTQLEARTFTLARIRHQADLVVARGGAQGEELVLRELLGMPPELELRLEPSLSTPERVPAAEQRAQLMQSPLVDLAKREHDVAERGLQLAIRKQWPELWIQPGWQEEDAQPRPAFGFSLPIPLWNANAQEIAEKRAARTAAEELLKQRYETASHALAQANTRRRVASEQRHIIDAELLPLTERQVADAKRLADLGQLDTLLILDAVTRAYEAQLAAVASAEIEAEATVELNSLFWPSLTAPAKEE
ncbi:MAG: TolC family protein, partial [Planctomycetota bacterium]